MDIIDAAKTEAAKKGYTKNSVWRENMSEYIKCPRCELNYMKKGE